MKHKTQNIHSNTGIKMLPKTPVILCQPKSAAVLISEGRTPIMFIRHGLTDWNLSLKLQGRENIDLNETGHNQAKECAALMVSAVSAGLKIANLYTSPLLRASNTAIYISEQLGINNAIVLEDLIERDYGKLSGLTLQERKALYPKGEKQANSIESVYDSAKRIKRAIAYMRQMNVNDGSIVAVTHGGVINALFHQITSGRIGTGKNITENCGISIIAAGKTDVIPLAYNLQGDGFLKYISQLIEETGK